MPRLYAIGALILLPWDVMSQTLHFDAGDPMRFGWGFNTVTGQYAGNCMVKPQDADIRPAGEDSPETLLPQAASWELQTADSLTSLVESMDLSASASASFAIAKASVSVDYARSRSYNTFHQFVLVRASVINLTKVWTGPRLTGEMQSLRKQDPISFLRKCGDTFVRTITSGGEFSAVIDISTSAEESRSTQLISASGNYATAQAQEALRTELRSRLQNRNVAIKVLRNGASGKLPSFSPGDLIVYAANFGEDIAARPYPAFAGLASYDSVGTGDDLTATQEAFIRPLFRAYKNAVQYLGDIRYVTNNISEFRILQASARMLSPRAGSPQDATPVTTIDPGTLTYAFGFVDETQLRSVNESFESYVETLTMLANKCLGNKSMCIGGAPPLPARLPNLARTFKKDVDWDTSTAGGVNIQLDESLACTLTGISGQFHPAWPREPGFVSCEKMPGTVVAGYKVSGEFDTDYRDNAGSCQYHFLCTRR